MTTWNDKDLTEQIISKVLDGFDDAVIEQIERLKYAPEDMKNDKFEEGYNWALRDVISILRKGK